MVISDTSSVAARSLICAEPLSIRMRMMRRAALLGLRHLRCVAPSTAACSPAKPHNFTFNIIGELSQQKMLKYQKFNIAPQYRQHTLPEAIPYA